MKKQFLSIFILSCISFQIYAMELASKKTEHYELSILLSNPANETTPLSVTTTENLQNNQPIPNIQDTIKTYRTIALSDQETPKIIPLLEEKNERKAVPLDNKQNDDNDNYEVIPLHEIQNNDREENFSSKCQRCCIPLSKEKVAELTKKNIDIDVYRENRCAQRKVIVCVAIPMIIVGSGIASFYIWLITNPETWTCYNRTHLPPCWDY